jgi:hypothetical protein
MYTVFKSPSEQHGAFFDIRHAVATRHTSWWLVIGMYSLHKPAEGGAARGGAACAYRLRVSASAIISALG